MRALVFCILATLLLAYLSYASYVSGDSIKFTFLAAATVLAVWVTVEQARSMWFERRDPYL